MQNYKQKSKQQPQPGKRGRGRPRKDHSLKSNAVSSANSQQIERLVEQTSEFKCLYCGQEFEKEAIYKTHIEYCADKPDEFVQAPIMPDIQIDSKPVESSSVSVMANAADQKIAIAIATTFDVIANKKGEHWRMSTKEAGDLAQIWKPVIDLYLPKLGDHPVMLAMGTTAIMIYPRIMKDGELSARKRREGSSVDRGTERIRQNNTDASINPNGVQGHDI